jgi:hypothetical protein
MIAVMKRERVPEGCVERDVVAAKAAAKEISGLDWGGAGEVEVQHSAAST